MFCHALPIVADVGSHVRSLQHVGEIPAEFPRIGPFPSQGNKPIPEVKSILSQNPGMRISSDFRPFVWQS
jgi:hypothetical protein